MKKIIALALFFLASSAGATIQPGISTAVSKCGAGEYLQGNGDCDTLATGAHTTANDDAQDEAVAIDTTTLRTDVDAKVSKAGDTMTGQLTLPNGSATIPSWGWTSDDDGSGTGMFRDGANIISIAINGAQAFVFRSNSLQTGNGNGGPSMRDEETSGTNPVFLPRLANLAAGIGAAVAGDVALITNSLSRLTVKEGGNIGIGNTAPISLIQVGSLLDGATEYMQIDQRESTGAPPATDCDADNEAGRWILGTDNKLYICNGAARGWDSVALTD